MRQHQIFLIGILIALLAPSAWTVDTVPWRTPRVTVTAQQRPVVDLLAEFASSQKLPITISENIKGQVSGVFTNIEPVRFLEAMCDSNNLVWFYDGSRLHVDSKDEVMSRTISVSHITLERLENAILSLGFSSGPEGSAVTLKSGHRLGLLQLVGGPRFLQAAEVLARDLDEQEAQNYPERIEVRTFRLKYATAADTTVRSGGGSTIIPGVATALSNLMIGKANGNSMSTGPLRSENRSSRPTLKGSGLAAHGNNPLLRDSAEQDNPSPRSGTQQQKNTGYASGDPMVVIDARLNAVIVRDYAARMSLYEDLIKMLDVPTKAIEITASIVDIDASVGRDFGVEILGFKNKNANTYRLGFDADRDNFSGTNTDGQTASFLDGSNLARGAGLNATALLTGAGYELLGRVRALEEAGKAQVVSSPSIFTMENNEAVIRTDEKVYVRVAGNMETDLFDVTTGVQFRVTPSLVSAEDSEPVFRLAIEITDGSFVDQRVDDIPGTRESSITTQAVVPGDKTLLLGGYLVERKTKNGVGIPILRKIPMLGRVFSRDEKSHQRSQRYFFITPRLVDVGIEASPSLQRGRKFPRNSALPDSLGAADGAQEADELARDMAGTSMRIRRTEEATEPAPTSKPTTPSLKMSNPSTPTKNR